MLRNHASSHVSRARRGQAIVAVVMLMSVILISVPAAIEIQGISNIDTTQVGDQLIEASQTTQSVIADYQTFSTPWVVTAVSYTGTLVSVTATNPLGSSASLPAVGQNIVITGVSGSGTLPDLVNNHTQTLTAVTGTTFKFNVTATPTGATATPVTGQVATYPFFCSSVFSSCTYRTPTNDPAFGNQLDSNCSGSSSTSHTANYSWITATGTLGSKNTQYQYVVSTPPATPSSVIYLYITARTGQSGNYTCTSLAVSLAIPSSGPPTVLSVRPRITYTGGAVAPVW
jgi:hypothetical protein